MGEIMQNNLFCNDFIHKQQRFIVAAAFRIIF